MKNTISPSRKKAKKIAIAIQKGGSGKTTTAINVSAQLAEEGYKVLVIDGDPQFNLTTGLGLSNPMPVESLYDALTDRIDRLPILKYNERLHVVPANIDLSAAEIDLVSAMMRETRLRNLIEKLEEEHDYDFIIMDCPPSLGILTINILVAANFVFTPVETEFYALSGLTKLLEMTEMVQKRINPDLKFGGVILTKYDSRKVLHQDVVNDVHKIMAAGTVLNTIIRDNVSLAEAPFIGVPIFQHAPKSYGAQDYKALTAEMLARMEKI